MSAAPANSSRTASGTLLSPLRAPLIDRRQEGETVARFVLAAEAGLVVLHGVADSGKSEFLARWVVPALQAELRGSGRRVLRAACDPGFPDAFGDEEGALPFADALAAPHVLIADNFDLLLDLPRDAQREQLDRLFARLLDGRARATLVIVPATRQLTSVYALTAYHPDAAKAVRELRSLSMEEAIDRLAAESSGAPITYAADARAKIVEDAGALTRGGWTDTFDLARLVHAHLVERVGREGRAAVALADYEAAGGVPGILQAHLAAALAGLDAAHPGDAAAARLLLDRLYEADRDDTAIDLDALAARLDLARPDLDRLTAALAEPDGLLRRKGDGSLHVVPRQLLRVVGKEVEARQETIERLHRVVAEGTRDWRESAALPSRQRFDEIHADRCALAVADDQARFLANWALVQESETTPGAARYWLGRIRERADREALLLLALQHGVAVARARAAALLAGFPTGEVRERLTLVTLADPDEAVRAAAARSLVAMQTRELLDRLLAEAAAVGSPYRAAAVEALALCPAPEIAEALQRVVSDDHAALPIRERAIRSLSAHETTRGVDALLDIALDDRDVEDREGAAAALGTVRAPELNARVFDRLGVDDRVRRLRLAGALFLVGLLLFKARFAWAVAVLGGRMSRFLLMSVGLLLLLAAAGALRRIRRQEVSVRSRDGVLAGVAFLFNAYATFPLLHGLAHFFVGMRRRGLLIFGAELLALTFMYMVAPTLAATVVPARIDLVLQLLGRLAWWSGYALLAATYAYDVVWALLNSVMLNRVNTRAERRGPVYRRVMANPAAAQLVVDALDQPLPVALPSARRVLRRFGPCMRQTQLVALLQTASPRAIGFVERALRRSKTEETVRALEALWQSSGNEALRRRIVRILARQPTESSRAALERLRPDLGLRARAQARLAPLRYAFGLWPLTLRVALAALSPALLVLLYNGAMMVRNPAWSEVVGLRQRPTVVPVPEKLRVLNFLTDAQGTRVATYLRRLAESAPCEPMRAATVQALAKLEQGGLAGTPEERGATLRHWRRLMLREVSWYDRQLDADRATSADTAAWCDEAEPFERSSIGADSLDSDDRGAGQSADPAAVSAVWRDSLAREALLAMAASGDRAVATAATRALVPQATRVVAATDDRPGRNREITRAVATIGRLPFEVALPLLDSLLRVQKGLPGKYEESFAKTELWQEIDRVLRSAMEASTANDSVRVAHRLFRTVHRLRAVTAPRAAMGSYSDREAEQALVESLAADSATLDWRIRADIDGNGSLDVKEQAILGIGEVPMSEYGSRNLLGHYADDSDFYGAARAFRRLVRARPEAIWPRKILAEVYHESLGRADSAFFGRAYAEMDTLRRRPAYDTLRAAGGDDYRRIEIDYLEVVLSARRYREADSLGRRILAATARQADPRLDALYETRRLNAALFSYMATALAGDRAAAETRLAALAAVAASLPADFANLWDYPGTRAFLAASGAPPALRDALSALCDLDWSDHPRAAAAIAANRAALGTARAR